MVIDADSELAKIWHSYQLIQSSWERSGRSERTTSCRVTMDTESIARNNGAE